MWFRLHSRKGWGSVGVLKKGNTSKYPSGAEVTVGGLEKPVKREMDPPLKPFQSTQIG